MSDRMTLAQIAAAAMALSKEERTLLLDMIEDSIYPEIDAADLAEHHWIMEEIRAGRMKTVPSDGVLAELDRVAELGEDANLGFTAELNRRIDEIESGTARSRPAEQVFAEMRERREAHADSAQRDESKQ